MSTRLSEVTSTPISRLARMMIRVGSLRNQRNMCMQCRTLKCVKNEKMWKYGKAYLGIPYWLTIRYLLAYYQS